MKRVASHLSVYDPWAVSNQKSEIKSQKSKNYSLFTIHWLLSTVYCLLFAACLMLVSCGKKGPPTLKAYEKPSAPAAVKAVHRENRILLSWSYTSKKKT